VRKAASIYKLYSCFLNEVVPFPMKGMRLEIHRGVFLGTHLAADRIRATVQTTGHPQPFGRRRVGNDVSCSQTRPMDAERHSGLASALSESPKESADIWRSLYRPGSAALP
jgi:hypothetical protein